MNKEGNSGNIGLKAVLKYITTVVSWTLFTLLIIVGILLAYYYISVKLYSTKGDAYEPKFSVYTIVSQSMEPTISVYDVIINSKYNDVNDVKINDVITYTSRWEVNYGMTITHRVIGTKTLDDGSTCYITRGDNNTTEDKVCVEEKDIVGVVKAVIPGLGKIQTLVGSKIGWLCIIVIPALFIIIKDILKLIKISQNSEKNSRNKDKKIIN